MAENNGSMLRQDFALFGTGFPEYGPRCVDGDTLDFADLDFDSFFNSHISGYVEA
ncbi:MAG: hypothetical protein JSS22_05260 [Proteobacteria bacterium]|nr:hypothetical protein [Pseudomonadota bacterium]